MKRNFLFLLLLIISANFLFAQKVSSAEEVLKIAYEQASRENKNVFLIFHASWCGWCHKMDSSMHDPSVESYFDKNYVITHLTVLERGNKKDLENPGAEEFLTAHGGQDKGIPFWIVLDKNGKTLGDSQLKPGINTGYPVTKEEVAHLVKVLERSSGINSEQKLAIEKAFRKEE